MLLRMRIQRSNKQTEKSLRCHSSCSRRTHKCHAVQQPVLVLRATSAAALPAASAAAKTTAGAAATADHWIAATATYKHPAVQQPGPRARANCQSHISSSTSGCRNHSRGAVAAIHSSRYNSNLAVACHCNGTNQSAAPAVYGVLSSRNSKHTTIAPFSSCKLQYQQLHSNCTPSL